MKLRRTRPPARGPTAAMVRGISWHCALLMLVVLALLLPWPGGAGPHSDHRRAGPGSHRDHDGRRSLRRPRRQSAGGNGTRIRRHDCAHVCARHHAGHQSELDRVRAAQRNRQAHGALAHRRPLQCRGLGRRLAGSRCAPHRGRYAVGRLPPRSGKERPRRHLSPDHRAGTDDHICSRACLRQVRAYPSVEGARVRAEIARPSALQWHSARHHRHSGGVSDRRVRRQPQDHFPSRRAGDVVRSGAAVRRLRFLAQAVPDASGGERAIPCRGGSVGGCGACDLSIHFPAREPVARVCAHAVCSVDHGPARHRGDGRSRSASGGNRGALDATCHRRCRRVADAVPGHARPGPGPGDPAHVDPVPGVAVWCGRDGDRTACWRGARYRPVGRPRLHCCLDRVHGYPVRLPLH